MKTEELVDIGIATIFSMVGVGLVYFGVKETFWPSPENVFPRFEPLPDNACVHTMDGIVKNENTGHYNAILRPTNPRLPIGYMVFPDLMELNTEYIIEREGVDRYGTRYAERFNARSNTRRVFTNDGQGQCDWFEIPHMEFLPILRHVSAHLDELPDGSVVIKYE